MRRDLPIRQNLSPSNLFRNLWGASLIDDLFNNNLTPMTGGMRTDVRETENEYLLEIDMPGLAKENINIEYQDGMLTISAQQEESHQNQDHRYIRQERHLGRSSRSYQIHDVEEDKIQATYRDGVLQVTLPKSKEHHDYRRRINIQ